MTVHARVENRSGFDQMKKAFRRAVDDSGVISEWRERERYQKPSDKKRKKKRQQERQKNKEKNSRR